MVLVGAFLLALLVAGVTFLVQRGAAAKMTTLDAELLAVEASSGRCEACAGDGFRVEPSRRGPVARTCWRCDGSGLPPTQEDRARFMPG